ncbi:MAG TPA: response regulator [Blastocatellia bacterium]|nr:response regulator [Blastocatellia bacterium]
MMDRMFDPDVIAGFIQEANGYLPDILENIEDYLKNRSSVEKLEEAYRYTHTIRGAASMLGFAELSEVAGRLEAIMLELGGGQLTISRDTALKLRQEAVHLANQLDEVSGVALTSTPVAKADLAVGAVLETRPQPVSQMLPLTGDVLELPDLTDSFTAAATEIEFSDLAAGLEVRLSVPEVPLQVESAPADFITVSELSAAPVPLRRNLSPLPHAPTEVRSGSHFGAESSAELAEVFALEAEVHLLRMNSALQELDQEPGNREQIQAIRRSAHSLKGAAAMIGFREITRLAHRLEDLLDLVYEGRVSISREIQRLMFVSTYVLEDLVSGREVADRLELLYADYAALLDAVPAGPESPASETSAIETPSPDPELVRAKPENEAAAEQKSQTASAARADSEVQAAALPLTEAQLAAAQDVRNSQFIRLPIARVDELVRLATELVMMRTAFEQRMSDFARQIDELRSNSDRLRRVSIQLETESETGLPGAPAQSVAPGAGQAALLTQCGFEAPEFERCAEFHLLSRELAEASSDAGTVNHELRRLYGDFEGLLTRQNRLYRDIQDRLMRLRLVPLTTLATRLHRTVRNVAAQQGKQVELIITGDETELDKAVLEELADPLQHLLRNAVDHGLEAPAQRLALGKTEKGWIRISAYGEGAQVVIRVHDDGSGLNPEKLRAAAVRHGFAASPEEVAQLSVEELWSLIFLPGFSTCQQVSEISGRGVGMDVVQSTVRRLKGSISVESQAGAGTTFTIRLPMLSAVSRALIVKSGGQTYAIPLGSVTQILRVDESAVDRSGQSPVISLNGQEVPLLRLSSLLNPETAGQHLSERQSALIFRIDGRQVALTVDQITGGREIVTRNLGGHIRRLHGVAGATIMGDGSVVLILNIPELLSSVWREPAGGRAGTTSPLNSPVTGAAIETPAFATEPEARNAANEPELAVFAAADISQPDDEFTVMVIDDSPSARRISSDLIRKAGWNVIQARDGLEALELLQDSKVRPDLLLLDIEMPRMDGYQLLAALRAQAGWRNLPVVMVSSRANARHRQKAMELGAIDYLLKPWQEDLLISRIGRLISEARAKKS